MQVLVEGRYLDLQDDHENEEDGSLDQVSQTERAFPNIVRVRVRFRIVTDLSRLVESLRPLCILLEAQFVAAEQVE